MNEPTKSTATESAPGGMKLENFGAGSQDMRDNGIDGGEKKDLATYDQADRSAAEKAASLDTILGISVTLAVELGRVRVNINELLHLTHGSVVDLNRLTGSPMDILANGTLVAHGEVVVVNDRFGIRLTDVVSPAERIRGLK